MAFHIRPATPDDLVRRWFNSGTSLISIMDLAGNSSTDYRPRKLIKLIQSMTEIEYINRQPTRKNPNPLRQLRSLYVFLFCNWPFRELLFLTSKTASPKSVRKTICSCPIGSFRHCRYSWDPRRVSALFFQLFDLDRQAWIICKYQFRSTSLLLTCACKLEDLYVKPEHRAHGIGKAFFGALGKIAQEKVISYLQPYTECVYDTLTFAVSGTRA